MWYHWCGIDVIDSHCKFILEGKSTIPGVIKKSPRTWYERKRDRHQVKQQQHSFVRFDYQREREYFVSRGRPIRSSEPWQCRHPYVRGAVRDLDAHNQTVDISGSVHAGLVATRGKWSTSKYFPLLLPSTITATFRSREPSSQWLHQLKPHHVMHMKRHHC